MSVKRYEVNGPSSVFEDETGSLVDYKDYAALEQRLIESERYGRQTDITIDNLELKLAQMAAENAYLLPKAASELSNAWVLHKYLIGIQSAIMYLDNGNKKAAQEWLYGTIAGPGFDLPDGVDDIDAWATHQMRGSVSHQQALEIIKAETPSTDAYLAEVRAQIAEEALKIMGNFTSDECGDSVYIAIKEFAENLRKGMQS
ncbi:hypothetical protein ABK803_18610 [Enterobacter ludwigii]|uniref:hypothetical protein n=1 Tax=Enterobacter ludwigii TaxID=299767 RepID=UPI0037500486